MNLRPSRLGLDPIRILLCILLCIPATACLGKTWIANNEGCMSRLTDSKGPKQKIAFTPTLDNCNVTKYDRVLFSCCLAQTAMDSGAGSLIFQGFHQFPGSARHRNTTPAARCDIDSGSQCILLLQPRHTCLVYQTLIMLSESLRFGAAHFQSRARLWGRNISRGSPTYGDTLRSMNLRMYGVNPDYQGTKYRARIPQVRPRFEPGPNHEKSFLAVERGLLSSFGRWNGCFW
ncbi:hypothetical protein MCOR28_002534 [Pyricularia oryzae]|nr:hypothetical protein MCOR28_002534 [Pyricularia oryzae]KAI6449822.1 hypothetical protein MCOR22_002116 [Pyricularia oryzae]